jgi:hypothetical protein
MASLRQRRNGDYSLVFWWKGKQHIKAVGTKEEVEANQIKQDAEEQLTTVITTRRLLALCARLERGNAFPRALQVCVLNKVPTEDQKVIQETFDHHVGPMEKATLVIRVMDGERGCYFLARVENQRFRRITAKLPRASKKSDAGSGVMTILSTSPPYQKWGAAYSNEILD